MPSAASLTPEIWAKLQGTSSDPVVSSYAVTQKDVKGPYTAKLPAKMEEMKALEGLGYTSLKEAISERFDMSQTLLANSIAARPFNARVTRSPLSISSTTRARGRPRVEVNKANQTVKAIAEDGRLIAFYPATIGSEEKSTPSGRLKVMSIDPNPTYHYNPKYKFKGVESNEPFTITPGPNNPVGVMWIELSGDG